MQINVANKRIIKQAAPPWMRPGLTYADLLGKDEKKMRHLQKTVPDYKLAKELQKLIEPRIKDLEKLAGQELNAAYLGYVLMDILNKTK